MNRQLESRKPRKSVIPVLMAAAVLLAAAIIVANMRDDKAESSAAKDIAFVWRLSSQLAAPGADERRWLIRYDASGMRSGDVLRAAGLLGLHRSPADQSGMNKEGHQTDQATVYEGELVIERMVLAAAASDAGRTEFAEGELEGDSLTISAETRSSPAESGLIRSNTVIVPVTLYMNDNGDQDAIVIVQPPPGAAAEELEEAVNRVEAALQQAGGRYGYSFRVSGSALMDGDGEAASVHLLMAGVIEEAEAKLVERYEDEEGAAESETRMSPLIGASINTNGEQANIQLSVHRNSESGADDWVIGVPVITGDYTPSG